MNQEHSSSPFDNLKIGYDNNADDDIDDGGDDVVINETFTSTSKSISYDHAGNLIDDGRYVYIYDGWNRLVKVRASLDADVTVQTAEFFADGRRATKTASNSGEYDETEVYLFDGQKIIEIRDGSSNVKKQFIHGTRYIDELVMMRVKDKGDLYVHQDANWNVIALTDLARNVVERYVYTPYGEVVVQQEDSFGDRDGDDDVDSTDKGTVGVTCTGTVTAACRTLDLDFDGDYDSTDATYFDSLPQGYARHPGKFASGVEQPFMHQGLLFEPEITQYQNRARQYEPIIRRFLQLDPLAQQISLRCAYNDGLSAFAAVRANPLRYRDPTGLCSPLGGVIFAGPTYVRTCWTWDGRWGYRTCRTCDMCVFAFGVDGECTRVETFTHCSGCQWWCEGNPPPPPCNSQTSWGERCRSAAVTCDNLDCQSCCDEWGAAMEQGEEAITQCQGNCGGLG